MSPAAGFSDALQQWGPIGLVLAAALDSFVPLAHVVDPMVVLLSYRSGNPVLYAGLAVFGSVIGTTVLFLLVRKGGDAFVARRMSPERRARLERLVAQNGAFAVFAGAVLPPPFPFKGIVLLAGALRMPLMLFVVALTAARAVRYGVEATLAVYWGSDVLRFMKERYPIVGLVVVAIALAAFVLARIRLRHQAAAAAVAELPASPVAPPAP